MTFKNQFVAAIKVGKKVLKETGDHSSPTVFMPFGSEYSIHMKNLSSQKAVVKVSIDGSDVLSGRSLLVNPNSDLNLERFLDNFDTGNKFLMIEKTEQISDHRGDRVDDGIVRIEFQYEAMTQPITTCWPTPAYRQWYDGGVLNTQPNHMTCNNLSASSNQIYGANSKNITRSFKNSDAITVKGSISEQKFVQGACGVLDPQVYVITIMLKRIQNDTPVVVPVTTKMKNKCGTCGTVYRGFPAYCSNCGTAINAAI